MPIPSAMSMGASGASGSGGSGGMGGLGGLGGLLGRRKRDLTAEEAAAMPGVEGLLAELKSGIQQIRTGGSDQKVNRNFQAAFQPAQINACPNSDAGKRPVFGK